jgi:aminoglycoside phosphotransferase (APT) family kinase protein
VRPGLTHFDLKPANLLFEPMAHLSLLDFELTRYVDSAFDFVKLDLLARHHPQFRELVAIPLLERVDEAV